MNKTGGSKTVTLTLDQIPSHNHTWYAPAAGGSGVGNAYALTYQTTKSSLNPIDKWNTNSGELKGGNKPAGGGGAHPNIQPYITVYYWKRSA